MNTSLAMKSLDSASSPDKSSLEKDALFINISITMKFLDGGSSSDKNSLEKAPQRPAHQVEGPSLFNEQSQQRFKAPNS